MRITGRKDVVEAVAIAVLTSLFTGIIDTVIEEYKEHRKRKTAKLAKSEKVTK